MVTFIHRNDGRFPGPHVLPRACAELLPTKPANAYCGPSAIRQCVNYRQAGGYMTPAGVLRRAFIVNKNTSASLAPFAEQMVSY